jgi:hypothetical protein
MMKSALLLYWKLVADLRSIGFNLNPYDPCIANKIINGQQMTIFFGTWMISSSATKIIRPYLIFSNGSKLDTKLLIDPYRPPVDQCMIILEGILTSLTPATYLLT